MNCLAIDDEPLAINVIREFCKKIDFIDFIAGSTSAIEAVKIINEKNIDLIFLDIEMPHITGLDFVKSLERPPMIIFTTAYPGYALEGFELNAIDYLVKPIAFERFFKAVSKAYELLNLKKNKNSVHPVTTAVAGLDHIIIREAYKTEKINFDDILYIEGLKDYISIYTTGKRHLTKSTMKNIEEKLPSDKFIRVHKSYIVALPKITTIENNRIIFGDKRVPIGDQYKTGFYDIFNKNKI